MGPPFDVDRHQRAELTVWSSDVGGILGEIRYKGICPFRRNVGRVTKLVRCTANLHTICLFDMRRYTGRLLLAYSDRRTRITRIEGRAQLSHHFGSQRIDRGRHQLLLRFLGVGHRAGEDLLPLNGRYFFDLYRFFGRLRAARHHQSEHHK